MSTKTTNPLLERLFTAGAHFGFSKSRRHPSAVPFLYGTKNGNDIIDIEKTASAIDEACTLLTELGKEGKTPLFVGTKEEISQIVKAAAERVEAPVVYNRWIGGMLTNFSEIKKRISRLLELTADREAGELDKKYTKRERVMIGREVERLEYNFGGMRTLERIPHLMVVVDPRYDDIAVTEARDVNIPVIGIMSSDCDATKIDYPIFVNDSLTASVSLVVDALASAYKAGAAAYVPKPAPAKREARTPRT